MRLHVILLTLLAFLLPCAGVLSQRIPASSAKVPGEIVIAPDPENWTTLNSTAFFSKPTTLLEHREMNRLRGIISSQRNSVKDGASLSEKKRLEDTCKNIKTTYSATKNHILVQGKVVPGFIPHCRLQVKDKEGLMIEQLLFVSRSKKRAKSFVTQTVTFFYPASEQDKAQLEITKFLQSVSRGDNG